MKNYGTIPLPLEHTRAPSRWPRISGRARSRAFWFALGFFAALNLAGCVAGLLPFPK